MPISTLNAMSTTLANRLTTRSRLALDCA